ncbi:MAG TPA: BMC domain-containing protein [Myxococcales bacterium]|nr:BMC domain-containing protein [Myxococcales bacterium]
MSSGDLDSGPRPAALALLEVSSLARGVVVADAVVKRAPVELLECGPVSPGKYLILFAGGVAEIEESSAAGAQAAGDALLDRLLLPQAHEQLLPAIRAGARGFGHDAGADSAGVVELLSVASALRAADAACKAAAVRLQLLHLARGIGGKAWFVLRGGLDSVEAAVLAATQAAGDGMLAGAEIIAAPHWELRGRVL